MTPHTALLAGLVLLWAVPLHATPPPTAVLTERAGPALEQAFVDAADDVSLVDAQIHSDFIQLQACERAGACAQAQLTHANSSCLGATTPAFCVQGLEAQGPLRDRVLRVLARVPAEVWQLRAAPPPQSAWSGQRMWLQLGVALAALVVLLLASRGPALALLASAIAGIALWYVDRAALDPVDPIRVAELIALRWEAVAWLAAIALGLLCGGLARRFAGLRVVFLVLPLAIAALPLVWPPLGVWDASWLAFCALLTALWHADLQPLRARRWAVSLLLFLLGLGAVEAALRHQGRPPPMVDDARQSLLQGSGRTIGTSTLAAWDEALFADPAALHTLRVQPPQGPWVLHLGDSMLFGAGLAPADAIPAQLQRLMPEVAHVNAGVPASSLDLQYALAVRLLATWRAPRAVVLHVFAANDLAELDLPVSLCGGHPVLAPADAPVAVACTTREPESRLAQLAHAPLPLSIVRAAQWSWLARRLVIAHHAAEAATRKVEPAVVLRHYGQIAQALRDALHNRQVPLVVAFMPTRPGVTSDGGQADRQLHEAFAALDLKPLDSQALFDARVRAGEERLLFLPENDVHLSALGAAAYAAWLAEPLRQVLAAP